MVPIMKVISRMMISLVMESTFSPIIKLIRVIHQKSKGFIKSSVTRLVRLSKVFTIILLTN
jgi:hypothetical protein